MCQQRHLKDKSAVQMCHEKIIKYKNETKKLLWKNVLAKLLFKNVSILLLRAHEI